jgi:hypothetical protein
MFTVPVELKTTSGLLRLPVGGWATAVPATCVIVSPGAVPAGGTVTANGTEAVALPEVMLEAVFSMFRK